MSELTYDQLFEAVGGGKVALRSTVELQPAGGPRTKVAPSTYGDTDRSEHRYAVENRVDEDGVVSKTVLLDSVASQANRFEEALLDGWEREELNFVLAIVEFGSDRDLAGRERISSLEAPHRLADAIFRDALLDDTLFRLSDIGRAVTDATPRNATAMYQYCLHALLFGMWDSTGPKGGLGAKFQRAIVSEIVGFDAEIGVSVGSRLDPFEIRSGISGIVDSGNPDEVWEFSDTVKKGKKPSEINHGNILPTIGTMAGGVTISHAVQSTVLSFAALRRLRFITASDGSSIEVAKRRDAETAARTVVAALGVAAMAYQYELDFDLRSRCLLIPQHSPKIELLSRDGGDPEQVTVSRESSRRILEDAIAGAAVYGLTLGGRELILTPADKFLELLRKSRDIAVAEQPKGE